ncbi:hypothetical protein BBO99_00002651 [Phytophthora kernoviae]|uniref:Superoxide dismutase copper/zinc binding domain-containing protein n=1 Tax=Phytophthora kernoviae TaxID=325452 RepID=A0A3R7K1Q7_9STRA|nr:hypothetical protein JM16_002763 [Phytophthora kernoviae]KAG2528438.1 hypothetical protein JM18_002625 [Phytophthora kernoviae]RLN14136.1 hypothetical protein BBI17_002595 [Phytophthora kernoviae]RLN82782.1 hypothetical protein BBO99_00002651 [Phytophthora kernoviae]
MLSPIRVFSLFALTATAASAQPSYVYKFDATTAGGVDGSIQVKYAGEDSSTATITAALDFSGVDQAKVAAFDGNCTEAVTSYKWHIHTKWNSTLLSDSYAQCSKAATGNHYDPLFACGPNSEYSTSSQCVDKIANYSCSPSNYTSDPLVCEKGDLSGKFGAFKLSEAKTATGEWTDQHYPLPSENAASWSIVLHAVCGSQTPLHAMLTLKAFVTTLLYAIAGPTLHAVTQPTLLFRFDDSSAAGIQGVIHVKYAGDNSTVATIHAALDFSRVNPAAIRAFDRLCTAPVTAFKWHIHVRWSSRMRSASFGQCSLAATGNHYDPLFACSPESEHINSPECKARSTDYACNPQNYALNPRSCEKGDLSGKFGELVLNNNNQAGGTWVDKHFPSSSENRLDWSIVLHAVCGDHTTRVACAVEQEM